ncbi:MAG TPA: hypothetical protein EYP22_03350, partial [Methanosarcinales archaeon]|nr:hypothetical protein [Methanosarcinales archaeon]
MFAKVRANADGRYEFNLEEWLNILISSIGLNTEVYSQKSKLVLISRVIPLVEGNV